MAKFRTHYDNLKIARNAPDAVIKAAYKALMQQYHPDKFKGTEQEAHRIAKLIRKSYEILIDPVTRAEHNRWIDEQEAKHNQDDGKAQYETTEQAKEQFYQREEKREDPKSENSPPPKNPDPSIRKSNGIAINIPLISWLIGFPLYYLTMRKFDFLENLDIRAMIFYLAIACGIFVHTKQKNEHKNQAGWGSQASDNMPPPKNPDTSATNSENDNLLIATRWPRFFARSFDLWWENTIVVFGLLFLLITFSGSFNEWRLTNEVQASTALGFLSLPISLGFDALIYYVFGNTPGKSLLGLKVETANSGPLNFSQYLTRNFRLWVSGYAVGIPLICFFTMLNQAIRLGNGQQTSYDELTDFLVLAKPIGLGRKVSFGFSVIGVWFGMSVLLTMSLGIHKMGKFESATISPSFFSSTISERAFDLYDQKQYTEIIPMAKNGDPLAQLFLGVMYDTGAGVSKNKQEAIYWIKKAYIELLSKAEGGDPVAQFYVGKMLEHHEYKESEEAIRLSNQFGVPLPVPPSNDLPFIPKNTQSAIYWLTKAAEQGSIKAQNELGDIYNENENQDQDQAIYWYTKAAQQGYLDSQVSLVKIFGHVKDKNGMEIEPGLTDENNVGEPKDRQKAIYWMTKAAEQGDSQMEGKLGNKYEFGMWVPQDYKKAIYWYTKAAEQGDWLSLHELHDMYRQGRGVPQNYIIAHMWLNIESAIDHYSSSSSRDYLERHMTPDQIQEAQDLATEWMKNHPK